MLCATFKLSGWRKTIPAFNITPELQVNCGEVIEIVNHLATEWNSEPKNTADGYCFSGTASKLYIRLIDGQEQIGFRFESKSKDGLNNIVEKCCLALSRFGEVSKNLGEQYKRSYLSYKANFD
jgi:hypothetical protein